MSAAPPGVEAPSASALGVDEQVLAFFLEEKVFGVPLRVVAEIHPYKPLNRIPHMPKGVEGILDLRGQVIPVVNLRARLGMATRISHEGTIIIVIETGSFKTGLLVDQVDGVIHRSSARYRKASRLLAGQNGGWVTGFLVQEERIISLLDPGRAADPSPHHGGAAKNMVSADLEIRLDQGLRDLIALAPDRGSSKGRIVPQIESTIAHTEEEMAKVLDRVEGMLGSTDRVFTGVARLKQEAALGRLKGEEERLAELDKISQRLQDEIFHTMQLCQYQDIARQKLERVLRHIQGIQTVVGKQFKEGPKYR